MTRVNGIGRVRFRLRVERVVPFCGEFVAGFNVDDVFGEGLVEWVGTAGERVRIECGTCVQWRLPSVADHIVGRNVSDWAIVCLEDFSECCFTRLQTEGCRTGTRTPLVCPCPTPLT